MAYAALSADTTLEAERFQHAALRGAGVLQRLRMASRCTKSAQRCSLAGFKRREKSVDAVRVKFATALLGFVPDFDLLGNPDMWATGDPFELAKDMHLLLEQLELQYFVTDGVAACCHGEPRTTLDLDLVIQIERQDIDILANHLTVNGFYVLPINLENAIAGREKSLSIIHQTSCTRVDVIINGDTEFDYVRMERRALVDIDGEFYVCSPEDTVLQKLRWGQSNQSEKQWRDVQTILRIQSESLDLNYMLTWAAAIGVSERLDDAIADAGLNL